MVEHTEESGTEPVNPVELQPLRFNVAGIERTGYGFEQEIGGQNFRFAMTDEPRPELRISKGAMIRQITADEVLNESAEDYSPSQFPKARNHLPRGAGDKIKPIIIRVTCIGVETDDTTVKHGASARFRLSRQRHQEPTLTLASGREAREYPIPGETVDSIKAILTPEVLNGFIARWEETNGLHFTTLPDTHGAGKYEEEEPTHARGGSSRPAEFVRPAAQRYQH